MYKIEDLLHTFFGAAALGWFSFSAGAPHVISAGSMFVLRRNLEVRNQRESR